MLCADQPAMTTMDFASSVATYGADLSGLICGFRFTPGQPGQPVSCDDVLEALRHTHESGEPQAARDDTFYWLHFNLALAAAQPW
ncbi:magnesium transporter CorA, partial [Paraburkholderia sp. BR14261]